MEALQEENQRLTECIDEQRRHISALARDTSITPDADVGIANLIRRIQLNHSEEIATVVRVWREQLKQCIDHAQQEKMVAQRVFDETYRELNVAHAARHEMQVSLINAQAYSSAMYNRVEEVETALRASEEMTIYWQSNAENYLLCVEEQQRHLRCYLASHAKISAKSQKGGNDGNDAKCDASVGVETLLTRFRKSEAKHYEKRVERLRQQYNTEYAQQLKKMQEIITSQLRREYDLKSATGKPELADAYIKSCDETIMSLKTQVEFLQKEVEACRDHIREDGRKTKKLCWVYQSFCEWKMSSSAKMLAQRETFTDKRLKVLHNLVMSLQAEKDKVKERDVIIRQLKKCQ